MKRIEDIKEFENIDSYYEISDIVSEVFKDRVEAHKHLVTANKEIERLNNIINELKKEIKWQRKVCLALSNYGVCVCDILLHKLQELKGSDKK